MKAIGMTLKPELSEILEQWQGLRKEALEMMGQREKELVESRIAQSAVKSVEVKTPTANFVISLDGKTKPQLVLLEEYLKCFIDTYMEDPIHIEWEERFVEIIEQYWTGINATGDTDTRPRDLATFLSVLLEIAYAWRFYTASMDHWRLSLYKRYNPDTVDRFEGAKEKRDRRHQLVKARVKGKRTLDLGCGFGRIEEDLVNWGTRSVVALDVSLNFLRMMEDYARDRGFSLERIFRVQGDCRRLPFKRGSFDLVLCVGTLFQIPHPKRAVSEIARLLEEGQEAFLEFQARNPRAVLTPRYHFGMRQYLSEKETTTMLESTGLEVQETRRLRDETMANYLHSHLVTLKPGKSHRGRVKV